VANGVIALANRRFTENLWTGCAAGERRRLVSVRDETDQACYIVERVLENHEAGVRLKHQSILFRDRVAGFRVMLLIPGIGPISAWRALDCMAEVVDSLDA
jgi:DNA helicase-2/ATP-dependent DNA helicase PcrA